MHRVLLICSRPHDPWRGCSIRTTHTIDALTWLGYEVDVLTVPVGEAIQSSAERVFFASRLPLFKTVPQRRWSLRRAFYAVGLCVRAVSLVVRHRYQVVHGLHDGRIAASLAAWVARVPLILERHEDGADGGVLPRCGWFERFLMRRADAMVGSSSSVIPLLQKVGCVGRACHVPDIPAVFNVPDAAQVARARVIWTRGHEEACVVVCIGSSSGFRGMETLGAAMPLVAARQGGVRFVWIGGDARAIRAQHDAVAAMQPAPRVDFTGRLMPDSLAVALAAADIVVVPQLSGTDAPMKLLDGLFSGTAVIAVDCPGARSIVRPGMGLLVENTAEALGEAILALAGDRDCRRALGRAARQGMLRDHSPDFFAEAYRRCYAYVINRHASS